MKRIITLGFGIGSTFVIHWLLITVASFSGLARADHAPPSTNVFHENNQIVHDNSAPRHPVVTDMSSAPASYSTLTSSHAFQRQDMARSKTAVFGVEAVTAIGTPLVTSGYSLQSWYTGTYNPYYYPSATYSNYGYTNFANPNYYSGYAPYPTNYLNSGWTPTPTGSAYPYMNYSYPTYPTTPLYPTTYPSYGSYPIYPGNPLTSYPYNPYGAYPSYPYIL